jgi:hypothetical protein
MISFCSVHVLILQTFEDFEQWLMIVAASADDSMHGAVTPNNR